MKKILLAGTALVATAGMAAAEINFSGGARFGIKHVEGRTATASTTTTADLVTGDLVETSTTYEEETFLTNRFTLNIDGNAETDGGMNFFARVRIRGGNEGSGADNLGASGVSAPRVGVSTGGFTLATGNIYGALESTPGLYDGAVGLTGLGWANLPTNYAPAGTFAWDSFSSAGAGSNGVEAIYAAGDFGAHLSFSSVNENDVIAAHVSYTFGDWTAALAHQDSDTDTADMTLVTIGGNIGAASVGAAYSDNDGDDSALRINGSFDVASGTTITGYATFADSDSAKDDSYGLGFTHSLGGATLAGGIADVMGGTQADFGVRFSF